MTKWNPNHLAKAVQLSLDPEKSKRQNYLFQSQTHHQTQNPCTVLTKESEIWTTKWQNMRQCQAKKNMHHDGRWNNLDNPIDPHHSTCIQMCMDKQNK